jgi:tetratricopeptide (TPR) repeat protein
MGIDGEAKLQGLRMSIAFRSFRFLSFCLIVLQTLTESSRIWAQTVGPALQSNSPVSADDQKRTLGELMRQMRWVEAAPIAQALVQTYPDDPNWHYLLGVARWRLEDPIAAIQALREAENRGMDTPPLHKALGLAYYSINQFILFEMQMDKASKLAPLDFEPIYSLGRYRESILNDYSGALKFFEQATLLKPDHSKSVYYKGHCQEMLDMWPEALGTFQSAIVLVEKNRERFSLPYQGMARLLLETKTAQALVFARKAVELEPNLDSNHSTLARIYELEGKLPEAEQQLQIAVRLSPNKPGNHYVLSKLYRSLGRTEDAQAQLQTFQKLKATYDESPQ